MKRKIDNLYNFDWIDSLNKVEGFEFKEALNSYIFFKKDSLSLATKLVDKNPMLIAPKILLMSLILLSRDRKKIVIAKNILNSIKIDSINEIQEKYLSVLKKWIEGDLYSVVEKIKNIIIENPKDIFAIRLFHFNSIFIGLDKKFFKTHLELIKKWSDKDDFYNLILGMTSFAYEENNDYSKAYDLAKLSLDISKEDLWSWHALLHVHDSKVNCALNLQNDYNKINWNFYGPMKRHLWWHQALFFYYQKNYTDCLKVYDKYIMSEDYFYLDFCNASSLLLRLNSKEIDVRTRMDKLRPIANYFKSQNLLPFIDFHLILFFNYYNDQSYFKEFKTLIKTSYSDSFFNNVYDTCLEPLIENILSKRLMNLDLIKSDFLDLGGSFAQRELIFLNLYSNNTDKDFKDRLITQIKNKKNLTSINYA